MLVRFLIAALLLLLAPFHRLSTSERKLVGTWEQKSFDGIDYHVLKPDHSYAFVMGASATHSRAVVRGAYKAMTSS